MVPSSVEGGSSRVDEDFGSAFCEGHQQAQHKDDNENLADALVPSRLR
jgi:hypothetical protein